MHVRRLTRELTEAFFAFHADRADGRGWCYCSAWWVPTWDGWPERTAKQNRSLRESLFARGELDGYLLFDDERPVGWCQVGPRDRLEKLCRSYELAPDAEVYAVTCFEVSPALRRRGAARGLLAGVLADLGARGVARVQGFLRAGDALEDGQVWTGPEALFRAAGFRVAGKGERGPVYEICLR